jgi:ectoine hydroxylase-related dioxygenase (phytanoyl-CoA dioxygenase family)
MNIFTEKFFEHNKKKIAEDINNQGFCFIKNAINENFAKDIINDVEKNRFFINRNWISGVYLNTQYYLTNIMGCSKSFYELVTDSNVIEICDNFMSKKNFRLKAARYYETFPNHNMHWHTDNKIGKIFQDIDGLIFIIYLTDVEEGEFQYINKSHKFSAENKINNFTDREIEQKYNDDIISFKGKKGSIVIYNTKGIHRAKKIQANSKFIRKSLFFQIDSNFESAEPMLIDTSFVKTRDQKILNYLGLGHPTNNKIYPNSSILTLPAKKIINLLLLKFILKKILEKLINLIPAKIKKIIRTKL